MAVYGNCGFSAMAVTTIRLNGDAMAFFRDYPYSLHEGFTKADPVLSLVLRLNKVRSATDILQPRVHFADRKWRNS